MTAITRTDMDKVGLFQEMSYLHGCPYIPYKVDFNEATHKGKQFLISSTKPKSAHQDGYFDKAFTRIFDGEAYNDPIGQRRRYRLEQDDNILYPDKPFKPTSPAKKWTGPGSYYGTFEKKIESFSPVAKVEEKPPYPGKNVTTNPPKKGLGYPDITINRFPPYFLKGEFEKLLDARKKAVPEKKVRVSTTPFVIGMSEQPYFDENPYFTENPEGPIYKPYTYKKLSGPPFIPPPVPKKDGGMKAGCFDKYPEYKGTPYYPMALSQTVRGPVTVVNTGGKLFRPVPGPRKMPQKSTVAYNVRRNMNIGNFQQFKGAVYCKQNG